MISLYGLLGLSFLYRGILAFDYEIVLRDDDVFQPCAEYPDGTVHKFFDMSNLQFKALDNESVHFFGSVEMIRTITPETSIKSFLQIYKKDRDTWLNTVYNFYRPDTCHATFDPSEIWYRFMRNIPDEQKKCPFYKGQKFSFDDVSDLIIRLPDPRVAGDYKLTFTAKFEDGDETNAILCTEVFGSIYRK